MTKNQLCQGCFVWFEAKPCIVRLNREAPKGHVHLEFNDKDGDVSFFTAKPSDLSPYWSDVQTTVRL